MKTFIYHLVVSIIFFFNTNIFSQSGNVADFFPLQTGNVWVYQHSSFGNPPCYCNMKIRVKVTGTNVYNGKTYYQNQVSTIIISCASPCGMGFLPYDSLMRVDSASGKVLRYAPGTGCITPNETMLDSLKARLNDTVRVYCQPPVWYLTYVCADTNNITVFGSSRQSRSYNILGFEGGWTRTYTKGIGLTRSNCYSVMCNGNTQLLGCVINGIIYGDTAFIVGLTQISSEIPQNFSLSQNYPNPFNPVTKIRFSIPNAVILSGAKNPDIKLVIYDALGKEIQNLVNQSLTPGTYEVDWDASAYPSGVYYYMIKAGDPSTGSGQVFTETKKMVLIK